MQNVGGSAQNGVTALKVQASCDCDWRLTVFRYLKLNLKSSTIPSVCPLSLSRRFRLCPNPPSSLK